MGKGTAPTSQAERKIKRGTAKAGITAPPLGVELCAADTAEGENTLSTAGEEVMPLPEASLTPAASAFRTIYEKTATPSIIDGPIPEA